MSTKLALTISHNIFLTREQRYALQHINQEIEIISVGCPVWIVDGAPQEPADEVFSKYKIKAVNPDEVANKVDLVESTADGYVISLTKDLAHSLTDYRDNGSEGALFVHHGLQKVDFQLVPVVHYVGIHDIEVLEKTL